MKIKVAIIALVGAIVNSAAVGMDCDPKFYFGAEAQYNRLSAGRFRGSVRVLHKLWGSCYGSLSKR